MSDQSQYTHQAKLNIACDALHAACAHIQDCLGVRSGDYASTHFCGQKEDDIINMLVGYIDGEIRDNTPPPPPLYIFVVRQFHAVEIEVRATTAQEAKYLAEVEDEYQYTLNANYSHTEGAPDITQSDYAMECIKTRAIK